MPTAVQRVQNRLVKHAAKVGDRIDIDDSGLLKLDRRKFDLDQY